MFKEDIFLKHTWNDYTKTIKNLSKELKNSILVI